MVVNFINRCKQSLHNEYIQELLNGSDHNSNKVFLNNYLYFIHYLNNNGGNYMTFKEFVEGMYIDFKGNCCRVDTEISRRINVEVNYINKIIDVDNAKNPYIKYSFIKVKNYLYNSSNEVNNIIYEDVFRFTHSGMNAFECLLSVILSMNFSSYCVSVDYAFDVIVKYNARHGSFMDGLIAFNGGSDLFNDFNGCLAFVKRCKIIGGVNSKTDEFFTIYGEHLFQLVQLSIDYNVKIERVLEDIFSGYKNARINDFYLNFGQLMNTTFMSNYIKCYEKYLSEGAGIPVEWFMELNSEGVDKPLTEAFIKNLTIN